MLVGERVEVETPHPAAAVKNIAQRLDGRTLESVEAVGKNLFLQFEGDVVLRSHLKMKGRWWVGGQPRGKDLRGKPWLVLRGATQEAVLWHGPILELDDRAPPPARADILASPPDFDAMLANLRALTQTRASARRAPGAARGRRHRNMWMAGALWESRLSPWLTLAETSDEELRARSPRPPA